MAPFHRNQPAGEWRSVRCAKRRSPDREFPIGLIYTGEALREVLRRRAPRRHLRGQARRLSQYADFEKLSGWKGLRCLTNALSDSRPGGLARLIMFESLITDQQYRGVPSTRLVRALARTETAQRLPQHRFGQLAADGEFFVSNYAKLFISNDWPTILGANLPSGGPAYPLSTPGVRLKFDPDPHWTMLLATVQRQSRQPGDGQRRARTRSTFASTIRRC